MAAHDDSKKSWPDSSRSFDGAGRLRDALLVALDSSIPLSDLHRSVDVDLALGAVQTWHHCLGLVGRAGRRKAAEIEERVRGNALSLIELEPDLAGRLQKGQSPPLRPDLHYQRSEHPTLLEHFVVASWRAAADGEAAMKLLVSPSDETDGSESFIGGVLAICRAAATDVDDRLARLMLDASGRVAGDFGGEGKQSRLIADPIGRVAAGIAPRRITQARAEQLTGARLSPARYFYLLPSDAGDELVMISFKKA